MSDPLTWEDLPLAPNHITELQRSAIAPTVARQRGYETVTAIRQVKRYGFAEAQCLVPGPLIPIYGVGGERTSYQFKPDAPRVDRDGKIVKYENPRNRPSALDVPPGVRRWVLDPSQPFLITEGTKKADSGASHGAACISLPGVWNWRSPDVLAELDQIPWKHQTVYLAFDSDWMRKRQVALALKRLAAVVRSRGAIVYALCLPEAIPGIKVGLDDFFAMGKSVIDLLYLEAVEIESDDDVDAAANAFTTDERANGRPAICVDDKDLERVSGQAWSAIELANVPPRLFRSGELSEEGRT
jgi:hypothetical protein